MACATLLILITEGVVPLRQPARAGEQGVLAQLRVIALDASA
jgi:hypothetical protein